MIKTNDPMGIMTEVGLAKMNQAAALGKKLVLKTFVLGDGGGSTVTPAVSGTALINQFAAYPITDEVRGVLSGVMQITPDMAQEHGGKWLREGGLLDDDGDLCVWVSFYPMPMTQYIERKLTIALPAVNRDKLTIFIDSDEQKIAAAAIAKLSGGMVVNRQDASGRYHVMVKIPAFTNQQVNDVLGTNWQPASAPHPAFIRPDRSVMQWFEVGMYLCSQDTGGRVLSAQYSEPYLTTFDHARNSCAQKGTGWHLMSNAEWAAITIWCLMRDATKQSTGNTYYGLAHDAKWQNGLRVDKKIPGDTNSSGYNKPITLTGSGPLEWRHNGAITGVADLVGNECEWVDGLKLSKNNNGIIVSQANNATESDWITAAYFNSPRHNAGSLSNNIPASANASNFSANPWRTLQKDSGYTSVQLLQQLLIEPCVGTSLALGGAYLLADSLYDHYASRGGAWWTNSMSGLACLRLQSRADTDTRAFRLAYYE